MSQATVTRLHDGPRNAVYHVSIVGDGLGDLTDEVIIDPTTFVPPGQAAPSLSMGRLWHDLNGFDAYLEFDYLGTDTPVWSMSQGPGPGEGVDLSAIGGLKDRSGALDGSGKLVLTTRGLGADDRGTIVILATK